MRLLERIKHLFNVERVVFVLGVDRDQLRNTVRHLYGSGEHADLYLRRFIDLAYRLPKPTPRAFAETLYARFNMHEFFRSREHGGGEWERFVPAFVATAYWLDLDLRTQEQCFTRFNVIARLWHPKSYLPVEPLCILAGLRVGKPELFDDLCSGKASPRGHAPKSVIELKEFLDWIEATFLAVFGDEQDLSHEIDTLKPQVGENAYFSSAPSARRLQILEHLRAHRRQLRRLIEFSTGLD